MTIKQTTVIRAVISVMIIAAVTVIGLLVTQHVANFQRDQYFEVRKFQAAAAAAPLDYKEVEQLKGDESDEGTAVFRKLKSQLVRVKETDRRIRFVYLMRPQDGQMVFLVDAEDPDSEDYSPPGQVYIEANPQDFYPFEGKVAPEPEVEGPVEDRWGRWISASAYILDPASQPVALLGTDVNVNDALSSFNQINSVGIVYTVLTSFLLALILLQWIVWRYNRDRREQIRLDMEGSLMRLNSELLEADQLKSEFLESASHELRGPTTAVDGALQLMDQHISGELDDYGRELLDVAHTGSKRMVELVNNLLDLTRIEAGGLAVNTEKVQVGPLLEDSVKVFEAMAEEKGLKLDVKVHGGERDVLLDPQAMRRVLENLVSNAIKYTGKGSIKVEAAVTESRLKVSVTDTGRGIPSRFKDEVFKKFSRLHLSTDSRERGAGLGLAISKGLVESHGGRIWLESEEGKGTTVGFELPIVKEEKPAQGKADSSGWEMPD